MLLSQRRYKVDNDQNYKVDNDQNYNVYNDYEYEYPFSDSEFDTDDYDQWEWENRERIDPNKLGRRKNKISSFPKPVQIPTRFTSETRENPDDMIWSVCHGYDRKEGKFMWEDVRESELKRRREEEARLKIEKEKEEKELQAKKEQEEKELQAKKERNEKKARKREIAVKSQGQVVRKKGKGKRKGKGKKNKKKKK